MKIDKPLIFLVIFIIVVLSSGIYMLNLLDQSFELREKANCMTFFYEDLSELNNLKQLCHDDSCKEYFDERINISKTLFKKWCLE